MNVGAGTLGLPANGLFTRFIVTHVSIRTSDTSSKPLDSPSSGLQNAPLPNSTYVLNAAASVLLI